VGRGIGGVLVQGLRGMGTEEGREMAGMVEEAGRRVGKGEETPVA